MFLQIVVVAAVACCLVECQIDISNCNGYSTAISACNTNNGLTGTSQLSFGELLLLGSSDITATCGNLNNITKAVRCIVDAHVACGTTETKQLVASSDQYTNSLETLCNRKSEYDGTCVNTGNIINCVTTYLSDNDITLSNSPTFAEATTYYCTYHKQYATCASENSQLGSCTKTMTKEIYVSLISELKPEICGASSIVSSVVVLVVSLLAAFSS